MFINAAFSSSSSCLNGQLIANTLTNAVTQYPMINIISLNAVMNYLIQGLSPSPETGMPSPPFHPPIKAFGVWKKPVLDKPKLVSSYLE